MGYYLQLISTRHQIRHPLWPLCWMRLPSKYPHKGPNPAPPLTIMLNEILPSTYPHMGSIPPSPLAIISNRILPPSSLCDWKRQVAHSDWFSWFSFRFTCFSFNSAVVANSGVLVSDSFGFRLTGFSFRLTGFGFWFTDFCFQKAGFSFRLIAWPFERPQSGVEIPAKLGKGAEKYSLEDKHFAGLQDEVTDKKLRQVWSDLKLRCTCTPVNTQAIHVETSIRACPENGLGVPLHCWTAQVLVELVSCYVMLLKHRIDSCWSPSAVRYSCGLRSGLWLVYFSAQQMGFRCSFPTYCDGTLLPQQRKLMGSSA